MRRLRLLLLAALAITAMSAITAVAANAESLPSLLWLTGTTTEKTEGTFGAGTAVVAQFNSAFATITAKLVLVSLSATSATLMADGGTAKVLFEGSEFSGHKCFTEGDSEAKGAVLIDNATWSLAHDLTTGTFYALVTVPETVVKCPGGVPASFKVKGTVLNKLNPVGTGEVEVMTSETLCETAGNRKAKWKEYDTHESTMATAKLEANGGLGFEEVCEEVKTKTTEPKEEFKNKLSNNGELMG
jgi:hypothetical protein